MIQAPSAFWLWEYSWLNKPLNLLPKSAAVGNTPWILVGIGLALKGLTSKAVKNSVLICVGNSLPRWMSAVLLHNQRSVRYINPWLQDGCRKQEEETTIPFALPIAITDIISWYLGPNPVIPAQVALSQTSHWNHRKLWIGKCKMREEK